MPDQDLLATCWTTAGDAAPLRGDERSPLPLRERVEATAEAGFRGIGLLHVDLLTAEREHGLAGIRVGLEFLPWSNIPTVHDGLRLVEDAGHDAGGLVIDVWHTERAGTPPAELASVPLRHIVGVELSDAAADQVSTLFEDTANRRRLCGEGAFATAEAQLELADDGR
ncbi:MAG TPA: TIM barrel protein [Actinomycetota bacterium]